MAMTSPRRRLDSFANRATAWWCNYYWHEYHKWTENYWEGDDALNDDVARAVLPNQKRVVNVTLGRFVCVDKTRESRLSLRKVKFDLWRETFYLEAPLIREKHLWLSTQMKSLRMRIDDVKFGLSQPGNCQSASIPRLSAVYSRFRILGMIASRVDSNHRKGTNWHALTHGAWEFLRETRNNSSHGWKKSSLRWKFFCQHGGV